MRVNLSLRFGLDIVSYESAPDLLLLSGQQNLNGGSVCPYVFRWHIGRRRGQHIPSAFLLGIGLGWLSTSHRIDRLSQFWLIARSLRQKFDKGTYFGWLQTLPIAIENKSTGITTALTSFT